MSQNDAPERGKSSSGTRVVLGAVVGALIAVLILFGAVLPAEYGVDPTGIGRALGFTELSEPDQPTRTVEIIDVVGGNEQVRELEIPDFGDPVPLPNPAVHQAHDIAPPTQTVEITIPAEQETEIKTVLDTAKVIVYSWETDRGTIYSDFHGHDPAAGDEFWVRYQEHQEAAGANGSLVAPFAGEHGWYWLNYNDFPVNVTLTVAGYYDDLIDYGIF